MKSVETNCSYLLKNQIFCGNRLLGGASTVLIMLLVAVVGTPTADRPIAASFVPELRHGGPGRIRSELYRQ